MALLSIGSIWELDIAVTRPKLHFPRCFSTSIRGPAQAIVRVLQSRPISSKGRLPQLGRSTWARGSAPFSRLAEEAKQVIGCVESEMGSLAVGNGPSKRRFLSMSTDRQRSEPRPPTLAGALTRTKLFRSKTKKSLETAATCCFARLPALFTPAAHICSAVF